MGQKLKKYKIFFFFKISPNMYSSHNPLAAGRSLKFLASILFEIWHLQNFISIFSNGRYFTRGDDSKKNMRLLFSIRFFQRAVILQGEMIPKKNMCLLFYIRNPYVQLQDNISTRNIIVAKFQGPNILKKGNH